VVERNANEPIIGRRAEECANSSQSSRRQSSAERVARRWRTKAELVRGDYFEKQIRMKVEQKTIEGEDGRKEAADEEKEVNANSKWKNKCKCIDDGRL
jgi:hypothetical protein